MQIVILGMHRSGTSMLTKLINMAGAYVGESEELIGSNPENPKGFWERIDLRKLNDELLFSANSDWDSLVDFDADSLSREALEGFSSGLKSVIKKLDENKVWVIKEPRICPLIGAYSSELTAPFYIHLYRNPIEVARSLNVRNGIPLSAGIALWERYNHECLRVANNDRYLRIGHHELMRNPVGTMDAICSKINHFAANSLKLPSKSDIESFIDPSLYRQKSDNTDQVKFLDKEQLALFEFLNSVKSDKMSLAISSVGIEHLSAYNNQKRVMADSLKGLENKIADLQALLRQETEHKQGVTKAARRGKTELEQVLSSSRWKVGNFVASAIDKLTFNKKKTPGIKRAIVEIEALLDLYS
ncbi:MAG: sulfotransferase [Acidiferrobacterales bacterium]|nr:sulfotransferase [Acidiferrobacterales bacterium]